MLDGFLPSLLVGAVLGVLSGLGVGGGSLLMLWLTLALSMDGGTARSISLLFFFPAAGISCCFRRRQIPWKTLLPGIVCGICGALLFSLLARAVDPAAFRRWLGLLLIALGLREIFYRE